MGFGGPGRNVGGSDCGGGYPLNCLFGARSSGSSSSPLDVRSITAEIGRFPLIDPVARDGIEEAVDASR